MGNLVQIVDKEVTGWRLAICGMRHPKNSWEKIDSDFSDPLNPVLGPNDLKLARTLIGGGPVHRKFLRMIHAQLDIIGPAYWVPEFDTYKVSTTRDSCSFMHKGASRDFTKDDFVVEDGTELELPGDIWQLIDNTVSALNWLKDKYNETKDFRYFRLLRQMLPHSYKIRFMWDGSYETLLGMYKWRHNHRLAEWHDFCDCIRSLPYMEEFLDAEGLLSDKTV